MGSLYSDESDNNSLAKYRAIWLHVIQKESTEFFVDASKIIWLVHFYADAAVTRERFKSSPMGLEWNDKWNIAHFYNIVSITSDFTRTNRLWLFKILSCGCRKMDIKWSIFFKEWLRSTAEIPMCQMNQRKTLSMRNRFKIHV